MPEILFFFMKIYLLVSAQQLILKCTGNKKITRLTQVLNSLCYKIY